MERSVFGCLIRRPAALARDDVGGVPPRPVVLRSSRFILAMVLLCLAQKLGQRRNVHAAESASGKSRLDLLQQPAVAVRVAERGERAVTAALWIRAAERRLSRTGAVEHFAHVDTAMDELGARSPDVGHDEIESLCRARRGGRHAYAEVDRA